MTSFKDSIRSSKMLLGGVYIHHPALMKEPPPYTHKFIINVETRQTNNNRPSTSKRGEEDGGRRSYLTATDKMKIIEKMDLGGREGGNGNKTGPCPSTNK
jgi:hypothetical protein